MMANEFLNENEKKVLELDVRRKLYETVKRFAGSHTRELERKSNLSTGSITYHLHYMKKRGLIEERKDGKNKRYFIKGFKPENKRLISLLRQRSIRRILLCFLINSICNHEKIVHFVKVSPSTISWHLQRLEDEKIIKSQRDGRKKWYTLMLEKNDIIVLLTTYKETFFDKLVDNMIDMWDTAKQ